MTLRRRVSRAAAGRCRQCESLRERCRRHPLFQPNVVSCLQPVPLPDVLQTSRDVPIDSSSALSISFFFEGRTFAGRPGLLVAAHYCRTVEAASAVYETRSSARPILRQASPRSFKECKAQPTTTVCENRHKTSALRRMQASTE